MITGLNPSEKTKITITNTLGQIIANASYSKTLQNEFQLSNLSNGIYFVTLQSQNAEKTFKIIK